VSLAPSLSRTQDGRMTTPDLSESEQLLWQASRHGELVDLRGKSSGRGGLETAGTWGPGRVVRADVIRALLLGAADAEPGSVPGVRLRGARITGRLDLTGAVIQWPLTCEGCHFDEEIFLAESSIRALRVVNSRLLAFNGASMRVDGAVSLQDCEVETAVRLNRARVVGEVCLRGAAVGQDAGKAAVSADGLWVDGDVDCAGLVTRGSVSLQGLEVTGSLDLTDARIFQTGPHGLSVGNATIGRRVIGRRLQVDGEFLLHDTTANRIELTGARLRNPGGRALSAGGLTVKGGMFCSGGFTAHGQVWMVGARLGANLSFSKSTLENPGGLALVLDRGHHRGLRRFRPCVFRSDKPRCSAGSQQPHP
jgi:hypothetical protein